MPTRLAPGRLVAIASLLLVVLALWLARPSGSSGEGQGSRGPTVSSTSGGSATPDSGLPTIAESRLPQVARETLELIRAGGPFPFEEDGQTFQNREGILPDRSRGYYREYTVTNGTRGDRGPLRIVTGSSGDRYWTDDHYDSFRQIEEGR